MITITLGEHMIPSLDSILDWFGDQGRGQIQKYGSHLLQWAGPGWIVRKGFDTGVVDWRIEVDIYDPDLELAFRNAWLNTIIKDSA